MAGSVARAAPHVHHAAGQSGRRPGARRHHPLTGVTSNLAITSPDHPSDEQAARPAGVRRTALIVAAIAVLVYLGFILSGVLATSACRTQRATPPTAKHTAAARRKRCECLLTRSPSPSRWFPCAHPTPHT